MLTRASFYIMIRGKAVPASFTEDLHSESLEAFEILHKINFYINIL
jgi:hypothetical protein